MEMMREKEEKEKGRRGERKERERDRLMMGDQEDLDLDEVRAAHLDKTDVRIDLIVVPVLHNRKAIHRALSLQRRHQIKPHQQTVETKLFANDNTHRKMGKKYL